MDVGLGQTGEIINLVEPILDFTGQKINFIVQL